MRRWILILTAFLLALALFFPLIAQGPVDRRALWRAREAAQWQGVLKIWLCETFYPGSGSFYGWLRDGCAAFEGKNNGVFIKIESVTPRIVRDALESGQGLPDAIVAGPGVIEGVDGLLVCEAGAVRDVFAGAYIESESHYAMALAAGGYAVIADSQRMEGYDGTLGSLVKQSTPKRGKPVTSYAISCPRTGDISYSAAMMSMLDVAFEECVSLSPDICRRSVGDAWADFVLDRKSAAYVCTQKEIYRMRKLEAGGSAFAWEPYISQCFYTDQVLALYTVATGKDDVQERAQAVAALGALLQGEESQLRLNTCGAFAVTALPQPLYDRGTLMRAMEDALSSDALLIPDMLIWRAQAQALAKAESGSADVGDAIAPAKGLLDKLRGLR